MRYTLDSKSQKTRIRQLKNTNPQTPRTKWTKDLKEHFSKKKRYTNASEHWKDAQCCYLLKVKVKVTQSCPALCDPMDYIVHGILQARILEGVAFPFSRGSSQPRDRTQSLAWQVDSLPAEPPGKPKNTGVGSLSLLQRIFPTQESNWGLLHGRWILYQLSYRGSPVNHWGNAQNHKEIPLPNQKDGYYKLKK